MKIARDFELNGSVVKWNETYKLIDNKALKRNIVSSTLLFPKQSTRGHSHEGQEEVYIFVRGKGFMFIDEHQFAIKEGDIVVIQDGEYHRVVNTTDEELLFVTVFEGERDH